MFRYTKYIIFQRKLIFILIMIFLAGNAFASNICSTINYKNLINNVKKFHQTSQFQEASKCINNYLVKNNIVFNEELYSFLVLESLWIQNYFEADQYLNSFPQKNKMYYKLLAKKYWYQGNCPKYIELIKENPLDAEERENLNKCQNLLRENKSGLIHLTYAHYNESQGGESREKQVAATYSFGKSIYQASINFFERGFPGYELNDTEYMFGSQRRIKNYGLGGTVYITPSSTFITKNKFLLDFSMYNFKNLVITAMVKRYIYSDVKFTLVRLMSELYTKYGVFVGTAESESNEVSKYFINLKYINPEKKLSPILSFSVGKNDSSRPYLSSSNEETFLSYGVGGKYYFSKYSINVFFEHRDEDSFYYDLIQFDFGVHF